jgi:hypothetical protein
MRSLFLKSGARNQQALAGQADLQLGVGHYFRLLHIAIVPNPTIVHFQAGRMDRCRGTRFGPDP